MKARTIKVLAVSLFAAMFVSHVNAQSIKYPKMHFGIRLGGTFNTASVTGDYNHDMEGKIFVTGGLALDFRIASMPLYLETGAYFVDRGLKSSDYYNNNNYGGQVPILLSYHHYIGDKSAIQPFAGGYVGYGQEFGYGVRLGVGINYGRLYANVGYDIDLGERDFQEWGSSATYTSSGLFATIGFNFGGTR